MSLAYKVLSFVDSVRRMPKLGTDPDFLSKMERAARDAWDGVFVALHAPVSPWTWEHRLIVNSSDSISQRIVQKFPQPVEIVGIFPSIIPVNDGVVNPTTKHVPGLLDIDVAIDLNENRYLTDQEGVTTTAATNKGGNFVTLASLGVQTPRLIGLRLEGVNPEMGFTFRWKRGPNVEESSMVAIALYARQWRGSPKGR